MGTQTKGPLGGFSGKTGPLIGVISKGKNIITSLHTKSKKVTQKQLDQRAKFGLITSLLGYVGDLIDIGFHEHSTDTSPMNAAVSYNLKYAVTGISPDFDINLPMLSFSRGKLTAPRGVDVQPVIGAKITFSWMDTGETKFSKPTDPLMIMVYNPSKNEFVTSIAATTRSALSYTLQLPADFTPDEVHCYLSFARADGKVSDSVYVGAHNVL